MAVQKSKKSRAKRGTRRAHNALTAPALATHSLTGEVYRRHHVSPDGYYKERQIKVAKEKIAVETEE